MPLMEFASHQSRIFHQQQPQQQRDPHAPLYEPAWVGQQYRQSQRCYGHWYAFDYQQEQSRAHLQQRLQRMRQSSCHLECAQLQLIPSRKSAVPREHPHLQN